MHDTSYFPLELKIPKALKEHEPKESMRKSTLPDTNICKLSEKQMPQNEKGEMNLCTQILNQQKRATIHIFILAKKA